VSIRANSPNVSACKFEVELLFAAIEAKEAERIKRELDDEPEPSGSGARKNPCTFMIKLSDSNFLKDYYAEANQQKLREFREGNADWQPVLQNDDRLLYSF
jgi:hypothetical protein